MGLACLLNQGQFEEPVHPWVQVTLLCYIIVLAAFHLSLHCLGSFFFFNHVANKDFHTSFDTYAGRCSKTLNEKVHGIRSIANHVDGLVVSCVTQIRAIHLNSQWVKLFFNKYNPLKHFYILNTRSVIIFNSNFNWY